MSERERWHGGGENPGIDLRRVFARHANRVLGGNKNDNTTINLGEHGDVPAGDVRFRDADEPGKLTAYIRQEVSDHKVIIPTVIALGVVAAGIYHLKHRKK